MTSGKANKARAQQALIQVSQHLLAAELCSKSQAKIQISSHIFLNEAFVRGFLGSTDHAGLA